MIFLLLKNSASCFFLIASDESVAKMSRCSYPPNGGLTFFKLLVLLGEPVCFQKTRQSDRTHLPKSENGKNQCTRPSEGEINPSRQQP